MTDRSTGRLITLIGWLIVAMGLANFCFVVLKAAPPVAQWQEWESDLAVCEAPLLIFLAFVTGIAHFGPRVRAAGESRWLLVAVWVVLLVALLSSFYSYGSYRGIGYSLVVLPVRAGLEGYCIVCGQGTTDTVAYFDGGSRYTGPDGRTWESKGTGRLARNVPCCHAWPGRCLSPAPRSRWR